MDLGTYGALPGSGTLSSSTEAQVWSGPQALQIPSTLPIKSSTTDAGSSPTSSLRPGLILGKKTSDGLLYVYSPTAVDGTEIAYCVLMEGISMLSSAGVVEDKMGHVLLGGILKASAILNLDTQARKQLVLSGRFFFDDALTSPQAFLGLPLHEVDKAANYQILATDNGTLFTTSAAVVFTLPAIAQGLAFEFLNMADANMSIASTEGDNIVAVHDVSADSITASTASNKIGARFLVHADAAGTKWLVRNYSPPTVLITVVS